MIKYNYYKLSKSKKIRYLKNNQKDKPYIVFLHGFMSDLEGEKPKAFLKYTKKNKLGFLAIEYSGHGKSSGEFTKGNISKWTSDTKVIIKNIIKIICTMKCSNKFSSSNFCSQKARPCWCSTSSMNY